MYFSNLLGDINGTYQRNKGLSFPLIVDGVDSPVSDKMVRLVNNEIKISSSNEGECIFKQMGEDEDYPIPSIKRIARKSDDSRTSKKYAKNDVNKAYTYKDLQDTEDNPLIVVCTKGIRFFNDVPTYLDVLFVNSDMMLVMLVQGACEFELSDGTFVALQRCSEANADRLGIYGYYDCDSLKKFVHCKTSGGWDKTYEMVCPLYVRASNRGSKNDFFVRCISNNAYILNEDAIKAQEDKEFRLAEEKRLAQEEARRILLEKREKALKEAELRREAEMEQRKAELEAKKNSRKSRGVDLPTGSATKRSTGAEVFLAMIENLD